MKVIITVREANQRCDWEDFCNMVGLSYWALREGMDGDTEYTLTEDQATQLGLIGRREYGSYV